ncbi:hypothetical protein C457_15977 [Haloferax prahovense DSM 18310]|uniref:Uncharacterized protein n=1 Tax=Haloferax prahovense (strain DSM 18310 / JCM 13924 / TL6) TaxID=1227461 RepID=M0G258_HALPT|nr:hypothetical protein [Haloferax prahovense]ELZ65653.1 hypothetical protein C457_15977 [Haloferax prahovense DSM 18310]
MSIAVKPMLRIVLTFAIVWFYRGLLPPLSPVVSTVALVVLAVPTWVVVSRLLFNPGGALAMVDDEFDRGG